MMNSGESAPKNLDPSGSSAPLSMAVSSTFAIGKAEFIATLKGDADKNLHIAAAWINSTQGGLSFADLAQHFGVETPDFFNWRLTLEKAVLRYSHPQGKVQFCLVFSEYSSLTLSSTPDKVGRLFSLMLQVDSFFRLGAVPLLGKLVSEQDGIGLKAFGITKSAADLTVDITLNTVIGGRSMPLNLTFAPEKHRKGELDAADSEAPSPAKVKWIEVNKSFKALTVSRLGLLLGKKDVTVFVDAGFSVSLITLEFYGLFVTVPIPREGQYSFGMQGLMVSLNKPPLAIFGGLYKDPDQMLFNGMVGVSIGKFSLLALGSYGETESGQASFFLYLMLSFPLGGPPFFFVTGLAAGFGINRRFCVPTLKEVPAFPFVAAATGKPGGLKPGSKPSEALSKLSDWLKPAAGEYFITAGVKFTSFNLIHNFALITVAFGNHPQFSLLGLSTVSLPPNLGADMHPIAYAQLALRVVVDFESGNVEVIGALTEESYLFDKQCKLRGGFALCVWSSGEYAGDFVVTLGGCHHARFRNVHYPELDKIGLNWQVNSNLQLEGGAYFAVTPACLMAGGGLNVNYHAGNLKAWLNAEVAFYIRYKPFAYDILISVSLGASYTLWLLFGYVTFKLELGASLHIWGPPFSGLVHVTWYIISFTVRFGDSKEPASAPLTWEQFRADFLQTKGTKALSAQNGLQFDGPGDTLSGVKILSGIIREDKDRIVVSARELRIETHSDLPLTSLQLQNRVICKGDAALGVVPMNLTTYSCAQTVAFTAPGAATDKFRAEPLLQPMSPGLWKNSVPDLNDGPIRNVPTGMAITVAENEPELLLPAKDKAPFAMDILTRNEPLADGRYQWGAVVRPDNVAQGGDDPYTCLRATFAANAARTDLLAAMSEVFGTRATVAIRRMGSEPEAVLLGQPQICSTGARPAARRK